MQVGKHPHGWTDLVPRPPVHKNSVVTRDLLKVTCKLYYKYMQVII